MEASHNLHLQSHNILPNLNQNDKCPELLDQYSEYAMLPAYNLSKLPCQAGSERQSHIDGHYFFSQVLAAVSSNRLPDLSVKSKRDLFGAHYSQGGQNSDPLQLDHPYLHNAGTSFFGSHKI